MTAKDLTVAKTRDVSVPADQSGNALMVMIEKAVTAGNFDAVDKLLSVKERWDKEEARKAFNVAFADFKSESVKIIKNTEVKDGPLKGKKHANLFDVVSATTPALSKHGLSISWKLTKDEPAWIEVTCTLRHVGGHSESVSMGAAPDSGPGRNSIQARCSSKTYLERYTATAILGLASQDADDDGRASSAPIPAPKEAAVTGGKDTFVVDLKTFLVGKTPKIELRGPNPGQRYRIEESIAKTAKANFKDGDTAIVEWNMVDGVKTVVEIDRKAALAEKEF